MTTMTGLLGGSLPSLLLRDAAAANGRQDRVSARPREREHKRGWPHVVDQQLFRGALMRERKRAVRFDQPFMVLLVALGRDAAREAASAWLPVIDALGSVARDTDVVGWFEEGATLGVILADVETTSHGIRERERKVRRDLEAQLDPATAGRVTVRLHVHAATAAAAPEPADALPQEAVRLSLRAAVRHALKRGLDIAGSAALILLLLPTYLLIAALVKLTSSGPVLFGQERVGRDGRPFRMLKFRTMYVNADSAIHQQYVTQFIKSSDPAQACTAEGVFKIVNDPRVTSIGRLLRKTSLDELPQFWNVLRGEMSLVGPRPPLRYEVDQYKPWHYRRLLEAKPGITGLWQVTGRSRTTFDDMVRLDLRYARTHSVWIDLKILLATPRAVFSGKGAC